MWQIFGLISKTISQVVLLVGNSHYAHRSRSIFSLNEEKKVSHKRKLKKKKYTQISWFGNIERRTCYSKTNHFTYKYYKKAHAAARLCRQMKKRCDVAAGRAVGSHTLTLYLKNNIIAMCEYKKKKKKTSTDDIIHFCLIKKWYACSSSILCFIILSYIYIIITCDINVRLDSLTTECHRNNAVRQLSNNIQFIQPKSKCTHKTHISHTWIA